MSDESPVFFAADDAEMQGAQARARATFKYFWRELSWEYQRIVPGLDVAAVKIAFRDEGGAADEVEHMWVAEIGFDGREVSGVLLNAPNFLTSIERGDPVRVPLTRVGDWMYAVERRVYGGHTVDVTRKHMSAAQRRGHDDAWGLDFGEPGSVLLVPPKFASEPDAEHPMSENMADPFRQQLGANRALASQRDERGWTFLHRFALAGSAAVVRVLLEAGADRSAVTKDGMTARQLAETLGWSRVIALLDAA